MKKFYPVCSLKDLKPGRGMKVRIKKKSIAIFMYNQKIYAIQNSCPHQNADLADGYIKEEKIYCALHHWAFELESGAYSFNPEIFLKTYDVKLNDGIVFVGIDNY